MSDNKNTKQTKKRTNKDIALAGVFIALAMILSYLESLVPIGFAVPGIKLGLANLVTIVALYKLGLKDTIIISVGRILLSGVLFGNMMIIIYSLAGAFLSILVMVLVKKLKIFSATGVSICGAISHNLGQIIVAVITLENMNIMYYMIVLAIAGAVAGTVTGILSGMIIRNIKI
ncbi:MAG: Gx transporter family protein [Lachnospiraceae bacterium]|nr:Gx transporter family protein [Lachnospiraceae bacterium]